jgi:hypothetical protein
MLPDEFELLPYDTQAKLRAYLIVHGKVESYYNWQQSEYYKSKQGDN